MASERLLDTLSMVLIGTPFRPLGAPSARSLSSNLARDINLLQVSGGGQSSDTLALALKVLGNFNFSGQLS